MTSDALNIIIIEDEATVRETLRSKIEKTQKGQVIGMAESVSDGFSVLATKQADVVFMDIKLKEGDAFHLLDRLLQNNVDIPPIVMMTGYSDFEYAQRAMNEHRSRVIRILQKPFWEHFPEVFEECHASILSFRQALRTSSSVEDFIHVKASHSTYRLRPADIDYIEVGGSGTIIIVTSDQGNLVVNQTLNHFLEGHPNRLMRIHRNNAINTEKVSHIHHEDRLIFLRGHKKGLSIGRTYYPAVLKLLEN